ncbi:MAG: helix-turn-helix domain-containing protein [Planctomycetes bacterium]|nr:helix-turn-helix domain-containing protein [Planctomycetota bacterium]
MFTSGCYHHRMGTKSPPPRPKKSDRQLERILKGCANHRRISIMLLLEAEPELSLLEVSQQLRIDIKTASEHMRRLAIAGLVLKRNEGRWVRHKLTERGAHILTFLRMLE